MKNLTHYDRFSNRHIGPNTAEEKQMLDLIGHNNIDELISKTIPNNIKLDTEFNLGDPISETDFLTQLRVQASKNQIFKTYIGMGYYDTITPSVILRNILENPSWYTQYTPYQAEISQGRLEALLNFQTLISDMTAMPLANASLLDEATAAAEAMIMCYNSLRGPKKNANTFVISKDVFPQTLDVLKTRAKSLSIDLKIADLNEVDFTEDVFGMLVQYPDTNGAVFNIEPVIKKAKDAGVFVTVAADLLSLALLKPPGEMGADVVVGTSQRFGIPYGYGGPHAAYFATKEEFKRQIPGRIIGVSVDAQGNRALRMALQTREQHIKRERATSNICTAQVLLAIMSGMYAAYHGQKGIELIAEKIHNQTCLLNEALQSLGYTQVNNYFFDTLKIQVSENQKTLIKNLSEKCEINFRYFDDNYIGISLGESTNLEDIYSICEIFAEANDKEIEANVFEALMETVQPKLMEELIRSSEYLTHPVFNSYHSETEMMRYIKMLEKRDLSLTTSMIPLGSCTMKLNAATEMLGITYPEFSNIHPFVPVEQAEGYSEIITELADQLKVITGFAGITFQPNSGAQGEYTGLLVIRNYQEANGEGHRNIVLIPSSAHGTNPASAVMAGCKIVIVKCDEYGNIDLEELKVKAELHKDNLSSIMVTYPSTHGVFEQDIKEICKIIHDNGGQVYMDGANMNAQVGLTNPYFIGADVCHLNLHKTFCIPHGGGGPGMGPIGVAEHLVPFLPDHVIIKTNGNKASSAVAAAPFGSANILLISYAYIKMMGGDDLTLATKIAILSANYLKAKLEDYYPVLYTGHTGNVGHELIFDFRHFKASANIEVEDVAKRLMDYGYHAPTVSFPVPGTLMVEPTESESKAELDRFCDAMISIREEIREIEEGKADKSDNILKNSPHTASVIVADNWEHNYTREKAAFPAAWTKENKFWPSVGRVDNAYGDRNLVCTCLPIEAYEELDAAED
ncbi:MAG: aminomethyl-transferring glycine dehydrogenase [Ignavibacteriae bacterium]|nr:glycine dehydrogenase (aminomethyl-transferring) [Ignavibacteriota bacterium]NOG98716.1 aminomethyl-transferring glycine dehydrogenase [Ignavibacteriota bacterium]